MQTKQGNFPNFAARNNQVMDTPKVLTQAEALDIIREVNLRIEPVLMIEDQWSPLYEDIMLTGIAV